MMPNPIEVPVGGFVKMNILLWNCRGALNADFKKECFKWPTLMVIIETRIGRDRVERIVEGLPFDGFFATDTIGYAGGLWLLWKKEEADVFVLSATEQEIHASVKLCDSNLSWLISSVYASPRIAERRILWSNLSKVASLHSLPWLLLGDFNEILIGEDKFGGRNINLYIAIEFKECINACNMLDLGFFGPKYTWSNLRQISNLILERKTNALLTHLR